MQKNLSKNKKVVLFGGAGLVGQNLLMLLKENHYTNIVVIDKHKKNLEILKSLHPDVEAIEADLSLPGEWENRISNANTAVVLQAQIGGEIEQEFINNNILATQNILAVLEKIGIPYFVHISSSVVNSLAKDWYTETKKEQEKLIHQTQIKHSILRPTLMFGLFDRKHLGWLSRFMKKAPLFPIPGSGNYLRQPLYVKDFCRIILACMENEVEGTFNITGKEEINYVDIIKSIKSVVSARAIITHIPYSIFWLLLRTYAIFDKSPPFTTKQLKALVTPDKFEVIDWDQIFNVTPTPFTTALKETFGPGPYANVTLEF